MSIKPYTDLECIGSHCNCQFKKYSTTLIFPISRGSILGWIFYFYLSWQLMETKSPKTTPLKYIGTQIILSCLGNGENPITLHQLTNASMFCITAQTICDFAGVDTITNDPWNIECALMTHTFTWIPSISRLWVSFCLTVKRYTLSYSNFIFTCKFNNLGRI